VLRNVIITHIKYSQLKIMHESYEIILKFSDVSIFPRICFFARPHRCRSPSKIALSVRLYIYNNSRTAECFSMKI
jgi:hypothetical protein